MEENLDEKKCPVCGRPNLVQAKKCWYCQAPLEEPEESHQNSLLSDEELLDQSGDRSSFVQSAIEEESHEQSKEKIDNTPEWLRRVRELIAADKQQEEPVDDWQQQQLFDVPGKKESKPVKTSPQEAKPLPSEELHSGPKAPERRQQKEEQESKPQSEEPEDLPDGFTPLSTHPDE